MKRIGSGCSCAVSSCRNSGRKKFIEGRLDLTFHKFPKDPKLRKIWIKACRRKDKFNPVSICSDHFKNIYFRRDLKAELLGYTPIRRCLTHNAVPTENLPYNMDTPKTSAGAARRQRYKEKQEKLIRQQIVQEAMASYEASHCTEEMSESKKLKEISEPAVKNSEISETVEKKSKEMSDPVETKSKEISEPVEKILEISELIENNSNELCYRKLYEASQARVKTLIEERERYMAEHKKAKHEIKIETFMTIKNIRIKNIILRKQLKEEQKKSKMYGSNLNKFKQLVDKLIDRALGKVFTKNQIMLIRGIQEKINWTSEEICKAYPLRFISKKAYLYVKNELKYPLPEISSLDNWRRT